MQLFIHREREREREEEEEEEALNEVINSNMEVNGN